MTDDTFRPFRGPDVWAGLPRESDGPCHDDAAIPCPHTIERHRCTAADCVRTYGSRRYRRCALGPLTGVMW